jgi:UDP-N-acetylglucosamine acyltransferase
MAVIHPSAVVSPLAELGCDVIVGPFCTIEAGVVIGDGCRLESRVTLKEGTTLGCGNQIGEGVVIGARAQHLQNGPVGGRIVVGDHNRIRENVTIHRAFKPEGCTRVGSHNMFMVGVHIAHDCVIGDHVVAVNNVLFGGHVQVADRAVFGGAAGVHQFRRVGALAMVGAHTKVVKDVPPYVMVDGTPCCVVGLNRVGLRRGGMSAADLQQLKEAYRLIYHRELCWKEMLTTLEAEFPNGPAAAFSLFFRGGLTFTSERRTLRAGALHISPSESADDEAPLRKAA